MSIGAEDVMSMMTGVCRLLGLKNIDKQTRDPAISR